MFDLEALKEILGSLGRKKLRLLATMFGIFWGSFMFILLIAAGNGIENGFRSHFAGRATNSFFHVGWLDLHPFPRVPAKAGGYASPTATRRRYARPYQRWNCWRRG